MTHRVIHAAFLCFTVLYATSGSGDNWPQFRGPSGQGVSSATNVPLEWDQQSNVQWRQPLPGHGWSSPVVSDGRIYLTTAVPVGPEQVSSEGKFSRKVSSPYSLRTLCLDYESGDILWNRETSQVAAQTSIHPKNSHASPTPVVTADRLFVHFGTHGTAALDLNGELIWNKTVDYEPVHGSGGSPILFKDLFIVNCDGSNSPFVLALDADTGEERWRTDRPPYEDRTFSFSTPLLIETGDQPQVVSAGSHAVCGYDPTTGKQLWVVRYPNKWSIVPRPVYSHGLVFVCTGYEGPAELLAIRPDGRGDITETHVEWKAKRFVPHNPSPVAHGDFLFAVDDDGIASCRDIQTGNVVWKKRLGGNFSASPVVAEERIYFLSEDGVCTVLRAGPEYKELAENRLGERTFASPVPFDGALLIRTENHLYRIGNNTKEP